MDVQVGRLAVHRETASSVESFFKVKEGQTSTSQQDTESVFPIKFFKKIDEFTVMVPLVLNTSSIL